MEPDDWERHKATILNLYLLEKKPLHQVASYMQQEHNFVKKQYQYKLKKWGVKKSLGKSFWRYVGHRVQTRKGKRSEITLFGIPLSEEKIRKEMQRYRTIPTADDFGKRLPSPEIPKGIIVRVQTPSIIEDIPWPSTLPWFNFKNRVLPALHNHSAFLKEFFAALASEDSLYQHDGRSGSESLYAISRNPIKLRKAILHLTSTIPDDDIDRHHKNEALVERDVPLSMATEMLRVVFFRLSNNMEKFSSEKQLRVHDQFVLHLVEAVSRSNPEISSSLFSGNCATTNAIKEAVYGSAIREKNYMIVSRLLESGVDPNLPVRVIRRLALSLRRGKLHLYWKLDCLVSSGMEEAAYTCDTRLGEILLRAKANVNRSSQDLMSPLALTAYVSGDANKHDDAVDFARLLVEHGATVESPASCSWCKGIRVLSPLAFAIAKHNNRLAKFLIENGANTLALEYSRHRPCKCQKEYWQSPQLLGLGIGYQSYTPLLFAIFSGNDELTERLLQPVLSLPAQTSLTATKHLLITSCLAGDVATVSKLLMLDLDLNFGWNQGITPLVATAWNEDSDIAKMLLKLGAHVGPTRQDIVLRTSTPTPMHVAAYHGNTNLLRQLIDLGADCNVYYGGECRPKYLDWLVPDHLSSPLEFAIKSRNIAAAALLIPRSNITRRELAGAVDLGDAILISDLISKGADILYADENGRTTLEAAVEANNETIISLYFSSGGSYRSVALYLATVIAVRSKDHSIVRLLTKHRPAGVIDSYEASSLVCSIMEREWNLTYLFLSDPFLPGPAQSFYDGPRSRSSYIDPLNRIMHQKGYPNYNRGTGQTPLLEAFLSGNLPIVDEMIERGYTLQYKDVKLLIICEMYKDISPNMDDFFDIIRTAVWSRTYREGMDLSGHQALLLYAIYLGDAQKLRECIKFVHCFEFQKTLVVRLSPLTLATSVGHIELVHLLLDAGANMEYQTSDDRTALETAVVGGHLNIVELLLDRGAIVNPPERLRSGATALQHAVIKGNLGLARLLIKRGADINAPPAKHRGRTALEGAAEHGRLDMVHLLLEMGAKLDEEMRIHYVRSIRFAMRNGRYAIATHLKQWGSWGERDQILFDRHIYHRDDVYFWYDKELDDWHIRRLKKVWQSDMYSVGSSDDSSSNDSSDDPSDDPSDDSSDELDASYDRTEEIGEMENNKEEVLSVCRGIDSTFQAWWDSMNFTLTGPIDLDFTDEEIKRYDITPSWMLASERGITELDDTLEEGDETQQVALLNNSGSLEVDCNQVPPVGTSLQVADSSAVNGHAADQQLGMWEQVMTTRGEVPDFESGRRMPEMDFANGQSMPPNDVEMEWQGPFFGAEDVNDYDIFEGVPFSL
ncbi:ankyrin repeat-containing domain protein [Xylariaceae sp. AK1471]|nr:ankyrin repeat-containing domain protein [Xylariaceae sp. AK1471]